MNDRNQLQQANMELQQLQAAPAPGEFERAEFQKLKSKETQLEQTKTDVLKLLTEIRSEKIRTQKIVDELEEEKRKKEEDKNPSKTATPLATTPVTTPIPSAGAKEKTPVPTPTADIVDSGFVMVSPDEAKPPPSETDSPPSTSPAVTTASAAKTDTPAETTKTIENSLSELSLKSGMTELRNDIHLGLHESFYKIIKISFICNDLYHL